MEKGTLAAAGKGNDAGASDDACVAQRRFQPVPVVALQPGDEPGIAMDRGLTIAEQVQAITGVSVIGRRRGWQGWPSGMRRRAE